MYNIFQEILDKLQTMTKLTNIKQPICVYLIIPKYWNRKILPNTVDSDQTPQNAASDQGYTLFST